MTRTGKPASVRLSAKKDPMCDICCQPRSRHNHKLQCPETTYYRTMPEVAADARIAELEHQMRMIVAHATGGTITNCDGMSVNDISVAITRFRNRLWEDAQSSARAQQDPAS